MHVFVNVFIQVVNEHYKTSGYTPCTAVGKHVEVEVTHDDEIVAVSADLAENVVKQSWNIEQQLVCVILGYVDHLSFCTCALNNVT